MLSDNAKSYLQLHLIVFIWGFTAVLGRLITLDALPLVWFRMLFAVAFVFFYKKQNKMDLFNINSPKFLGGTNVHNVIIIAGLAAITWKLYKK